MHRIVLLLLSIWLPTLLLGQDLSGRWIGTFTPNQEQDGKVYSYELDIKELPNHNLSVITYTKISNNFSAKAIANGMHSESTQLVSVIETKFENIQLLGNFQACLMTNYLTYNTIRGRETLEGTYISSNSKLGKDCGSGIVYLEKAVPFVKMLPKNVAGQNNKLITKNNKKIEQPENKTAPINKLVLQNTTPASTKNNIVSNIKETVVPSNSTSLQKKNRDNTSKSSKEAPPISLDNSTNVNLIEQSISKTKEENTVLTNSNSNSISTINSNSNSNSNSIDNAKSTNRSQILPYVLIGRENKLVSKITVTSPHISFDLYDNGTIDNDSIMIYDNKIQILANQRLSYKAIHFELDFNKEVTEHEIIIVAQNLGSVPPNTALMILKEGNSRKEYFITSTLQTNAMLIINYKAPN
jgi:hypothetical protein